MGESRPFLPAPSSAPSLQFGHPTFLSVGAPYRDLNEFDCVMFPRGLRCDLRALVAAKRPDLGTEMADRYVCMRAGHSPHTFSAKCHFRRLYQMQGVRPSTAVRSALKLFRGHTKAEARAKAHKSARLCSMQFGWNDTTLHYSQ